MRWRWPWYRSKESDIVEDILTMIGVDYKHQFIKKATIIMESQEAPVVILEVYLENCVDTEEKVFTLVKKEKIDVRSSVREVREAKGAAEL